MFARSLAVALTADLLLSLAGTSAQAASGPIWQGTYIGGSIGWQGLSVTETDTVTTVPVALPDPTVINQFSGGPSSGFAGAITAGYDHLISPMLLIGVFGRLDLSNAQTTQISPGGDVDTARQSFAVDLGGRIGWMGQKTTLYQVNGGYSRAGFDYSYDTTQPDTYSSGHIFNGWFLGAGIEHKLTDALSVSLDYRYASYQRAQVGIIFPPSITETHEIQPVEQSVLVGLVYNLGQ